VEKIWHSLEVRREVIVTDVDDILTHYGLRGMHWGIRKAASTNVNPSEVKVMVVPGKGIRTSGGKGRPPSEDAINTAITRQVARASSLHALSNVEIQKALNRMNLENQYSKITTPKDSPAKAFIKKLLGDTGKAEITALSKGAPGPLMKQLDVALASQSKGRHTRKVLNVVSPATGRHRS
jgi:hypothetical protein